MCYYESETAAEAEFASEHVGRSGHSSVWRIIRFLSFSLYSERVNTRSERVRSRSGDDDNTQATAPIRYLLSIYIFHHYAGPSARRPHDKCDAMTSQYSIPHSAVPCCAQLLNLALVYLWVYALPIRFPLVFYNSTARASSSTQHPRHIIVSTPHPVISFALLGCRGSFR